MGKIAIFIFLLVIVISALDKSGNLERSSVTVPVGSYNYQTQKQDELRKKSLCEAEGGFYHGIGRGCENEGYTILNEEIIKHD